MRHLLFAALLLAGGAQAQGLRQSTCGEFLELARPMLNDVGVQIANIRSSVRQGWCVYSGIEADQSSYARMVYTIDEVRLRGDGLESLLAEPGTADFSLPFEFELEIEHLRMIPSTSQADFDYMLRAQSKRNWIDLRLRTLWDAETKNFAIDGAEAKFASGDYIWLALDVDGVDPSKVNTPLPLAAQMRVNEVALTVQNTNGSVFEGLILPQIMTALYQDFETPEKVGEFVQKAAMAGLALVPERVFESGARAALSNVIADLPNPNGKLVLKAVFDGGLKVEEVMGFLMNPPLANPLEGLPANLKIEAFYDRKPLD